jgi:cyclophilin family peptidyl-prolyl cis-trans isomerase
MSIMFLYFRNYKTTPTMKHLLLSAILAFGLFCSGSAQSEVTFYTNNGNFVLLLHDSVMPITAGNFKTLVDTKFYDGVIFHRIISNFMIQGGDPTGTGSGGPGYTIQDEFVAGQSNIKKTISMANTGQPNSGGSQFFINVKNNTFLDFDKAPLSSKHPVFGEVTSGWTVVETIKNVPTNSSDRPITDVVMDSLRTTGSVLSVEEIETNKTLTSIYPNPISNESVLDLYLDKAQKVSVELLDMNGKVLFKTQENLGSGKALIPLYNLGVVELSSGTYFLSIIGISVSKKEKFIISN